MWMSFLAQSRGTEQVGDLFSALAWLVAVCVGALLVGVAIYKRFSPNIDRGQPSTTFSLSALRRMRDEGQLTEEEYRRACGKVIGEGQDLIGDNEGSAKVEKDQDGSDSDKRH